MTNISKIRQLSRDPYGRFDAVRTLASSKSDGKQCDWCGRQTTLYSYGTWSDGGRFNWSAGSFCSRGCHGSYHG